MDARLSLGPHMVNNGTTFGSGPVKLSANLMIDYGDPFELRDRKPYDHFKVWGEFTNAYQRKYLGGVTGYGLLTGTNVHLGNWQMLMGLYQHFDYFDNLTFELGDVAFGGGIESKLPIGEHHDLYSNLHLSFMPFAANNASFFPIDTTQTRDYSYGDGFQVMTETGFSIGDHFLDVSAIGYYFYFSSFYGVPTKNSIVLLKPRLAINLWKNFDIGAEHQNYLSDRTSPSLAAATIKRTEQRFFIQWNWNHFPHSQ
ncbi:MAG: hypothetical protein Q8921_13060 [Bacteroidota bacterium]|nr:hypothetical protein [Bacteroidota bacterium]